MSEGLKKETVARFFKKVVPNGDCLEWTGFCLRRRWSGYGVITMNRKQYRTHRFAWMIAHGNIPNGMCVCHKCDNPKCVNPQHLFLGTLIDNNKDRDRKKRNGIVYGEKNGLSKLTLKSVREIKNTLKYFNFSSYAQLGKQYGVRWQTIQAIAKGKTWKNV